VALYCSPTCQALHWNSGHKSECRVVRDVRALMPKLPANELAGATQRLKKFAASLQLAWQLDHQCFYIAPLIPTVEHLTTANSEPAFVTMQNNVRHSHGFVSSRSWSVCRTHLSISSRG
jgi:hypothetical protein